MPVVSAEIISLTVTTKSKAFFAFTTVTQRPQRISFFDLTGRFPSDQNPEPFRMRELVFRASCPARARASSSNRYLPIGGKPDGLVLCGISR
jgi:hypothetical protein